MAPVERIVDGGVALLSPILTCQRAPLRDRNDGDFGVGEPDQLHEPSDDCVTAARLHQCVHRRSDANAGVIARGYGARRGRGIRGCLVTGTRPHRCCRIDSSVVVSLGANRSRIRACVCGVQ